jgi:hypothetical protein
VTAYFRQSYGANPGEITSFEVPIGPPSSSLASSSQKAIPDHGMYPVTRTPLDYRSIRGLRSEYFSGDASTIVVTPP